MTDTGMVPLFPVPIRYGLACVVAVTIGAFTVVDAAAVGMSGEPTYGPFGIDIGPLGWFESATSAHGMAYAGVTAALADAFVAATDEGRQRG